MNKFTFLKSYFSPFIPIKPTFYIGKLRYGTPYFLPRKWVKYTQKEIDIETGKEWNSIKECWEEMFKDKYTYSYFQTMLGEYDKNKTTIRKSK